MLNTKYGCEPGSPELSLEGKVIKLSRMASEPIKNAMQTGYKVALLDESKGALPNWFRESFPEDYSILAKLKASVLGGRETVRAKYIYLLAFGEYPKCKICGKDAKGLSDRPLLSAYYCGKRCRYEGLKLEREATMLKEHGVANIFASKEFSENRIVYLQDRYGSEVTGPTKVPGAAEKIQQTSMDRYGVPNFAQSNAVKNKRVKTIQKRYGKQYTAPFQLPHVKEAIRISTLKRFGVEHNSQSEFIKSKKIATSRKNYGTDYPMQTQEVKDSIVATNQTRYGVDHLAHLPGWFDPSRGFKRYTVSWRGKQVVCQGYEVEVLEDLAKHKNISSVTTNSQYIGVVPYTKPNGKQSAYHPEIAFKTIKGKVFILEVKSTFTLFGSEGVDTLNNNLAKFRAAAKHYATRNMEFVLCVWSKGSSHIIREPHQYLLRKLRTLGIVDRNHVV